MSQHLDESSNTRHGKSSSIISEQHDDKKIFSSHNQTPLQYRVDAVYYSIAGCLPSMEDQGASRHNYKMNLGCADQKIFSKRLGKYDGELRIKGKLIVPLLTPVQRAETKICTPFFIKLFLHFSLASYRTITLPSRPVSVTVSWWLTTAQLSRNKNNPRMPHEALSLEELHAKGHAGTHHIQEVPNQHEHLYKATPDSGEMIVLRLEERGLIPNTTYSVLCRVEFAYDDIVYAFDEYENNDERTYHDTMTFCSAFTTRNRMRGERKISSASYASLKGIEGTHFNSEMSDERLCQILGRSQTIDKDGNNCTQTVSQAYIDHDSPCTTKVASSVQPTRHNWLHVARENDRDLSAGGALRSCYKSDEAVDSYIATCSPAHYRLHDDLRCSNKAVAVQPGHDGGFSASSNAQSGIVTRNQQLPSDTGLYAPQSATWKYQPKSTAASSCAEPEEALSPRYKLSFVPNDSSVESRLALLLQTQQKQKNRMCFTQRQDSASLMRAERFQKDSFSISTQQISQKQNEKPQEQYRNEIEYFFVQEIEPIYHTLRQKHNGSQLQIDQMAWAALIKTIAAKYYRDHIFYSSTASKAPLLTDKIKCAILKDITREIKHFIS